MTSHHSQCRAARAENQLSEAKVEAKTAFPFTVSFVLISAASCSFLLTGEDTRAVVQVHLSYDTLIYLSIQESTYDLCV